MKSTILSALLLSTPITAFLHARSYNEGYQAGLLARDLSYGERDESLYARSLLDSDYEDYSALSERDLDDLLDEYLQRREPSGLLKNLVQTAKGQVDTIASAAKDKAQQTIDSKNQGASLNRRPTFIDSATRKEQQDKQAEFGKFTKSKTTKW